MQIGLVETMDQLRVLEEAWCDIYRRDPESQFYLSWWWLTDYLNKSNDDWVVLTATPDGADRPVAIFPLRMKLRRRQKDGLFLCGYAMAGNYSADYTGFLCLPEFEDQAIPAFAEHLQTMAWAFLKLEYLRASDKRKALFLDAFPEKTFSIQSETRVNEVDNVDNLICPYVDLPDTFDAYLSEKLSANSRQKLRRLLRKVDAGEDYRITHADAGTIDRDIEILLEFWLVQWAERKGDQAQSILHNNRVVLRSGFDLGRLYMPVLWKGDRPVAALGSFLDHEKKTVLFMIAGRDQSFGEIPSGLALHAHSIRHAIENGFRTYDFLRGNEPYKYSFGCQELIVDCITIATRSGVNHHDRIARRLLPVVFKQVAQLHKQQNRAEAEAGYRQILATEPRHPGAHYGLGQLLASSGDDAEASQHYEAVTAIQPNNTRAWLRLAQVYQRLSEIDAACEAYRKSIALEAGLFSARFSLAKCLADTDRPDEAVDVLQAIMRMAPTSDQDRAIAVEATKLLSVLKPGFVFSHPLVQSISPPGKAPLIVLHDKGQTEETSKPSEK